MGGDRSTRALDHLLMVGGRHLEFVLVMNFLTGKVVRRRTQGYGRTCAEQPRRPRSVPPTSRSGPWLQLRMARCRLLAGAAQFVLLEVGLYGAAPEKRTLSAVLA